MVATAIPQDSVFGRINSLIAEIGGTEKRASDTELGLTGEGKKDPGGYQGPSDHPSARAASNVEKTPLGSRAKENEKDVKEEHPGAGVDNTDPKSGGDQDDKQFNIGTKQRAVGEMPEVEQHYRAGGKDDKRQGDRGGTEGPFNAEEIGEKYSSLQLPVITKLAYDKMNNVLADIANGVHIKEAMEMASGNFNPAAPQAQLSPKTAAAAGYELAAQAGQEEALQKQAAIQATVEQTILDAHTNADLVGEYLTKYAAECERLIKQSDGGPMGGGMEGGGEMPPPGAEGPPPGAEGPPPGGPPGAGPGDGGGGEGIDEIINALLDMGYTPEDVMQALQEHAGGAGGGAGGPPPGAEGPPPGAEMGAGPPGGGMPPEAGMKAGAANDREVLFKLAAAASDRFRSGKWMHRPVQSGTKEATDRQELQRYIVEVCQGR